MELARTGLVEAFFPAASAAERASMVARMLESAKPSKQKRKTPESLYSVLQVLSTEDDFSKLADLKLQLDDERREKLIIKREGYHHERAQEFTPKLIKDLRPPGPGIYISMQVSARQFAGYYEKADIEAASTAKGKRKAPR